MKVSVTGDKNLIGQLQALRTTRAKAAIRKGSRAGSKLIQARAKQNVPVITGALKREVKVRALPRSRRWTGTKVTTKVEGGPTYYGGFVELGTKHAKARGFIKAAVESEKSAASAALVDAIRDELSRDFQSKISALG